MSNMKSLQPNVVFSCFEEVTKVPRPSKREEKMIDFLTNFGKELELETIVDETGNVLIRKPATPGYENCKTIILQSHMDMVCEPSDGSFDFNNNPIETVIDGEWLKANGTTLGADDGIGVAMQMAILKSTDIEHGPIECVFTRDEETGLTGAMGMKPGFMTGSLLINLDSEDEGQIFVSCAGGARTTAEFECKEEAIPANYYTFRVGVKGFTGGHSGDDINKKRANANKVLIRFICDEMAKMDLRLVDIQSGGLHNAIPREGYAVCAIPMSQKEQIRIDLNIYQSILEEEYSNTEKNFVLTLDSIEPAVTAMNAKDAERMLLSLRVVHNGVFAMSQDLDWLVETSSNLASIRKQDGKIIVTTSQRSSLQEARENISATVRAAFILGGARVETNEGYPGWKMNPNSLMLKITKESYERLFHQEPQILAIHAGLECGLFSEKYPGLDMVSFGPTLRGVHSPDERLLIPTVQKVWDHLLDILKHIPQA
ncbi:cytosol non-specific dipeptidase [Bacteroidaceae bacterium]|uniref:aminoacyl-histidine dipeptidase n=1 Tax=Prevotella sp. MGM2 TaxID=2033406 RepID=UPI000CEA2408|nr:aminoacyl-histidine dipeptidase [Prevotella sp. MGM2]GAY31156.1 aminoacyl-histidine dipeptidase [Prevotella sp. MGM2]GFI34484.1 cytosol non-specific dipeptidase [Bacteroidaceae bacterium]